MSDKTYGRKVIRETSKRYQRRLVLSWLICFLIGFLIGCVIMSGFVHIFTCVDVVNAEDAPVPSVVCEPERTSLGVFKLTAYCACEKCCGKTDGITASGVKAVEGVTIAADTTILPFDTKIVIDDVGERIVQDIGGAIKGNRIDVYFDTHQDALDFGVQYKEIYKMKEGEEYGEV